MQVIIDEKDAMIASLRSEMERQGRVIDMLMDKIKEL